ncbi:archaemetzincin-2 isoform X2 [Nematostella vectensis]|uniref:archaemetzincin-2 isoform X2 n=1 Tax=Nematostella vectensis TaxID=45351 RepID=UPI0020779716|nr:archaemetzincin-2 isoform X2 [Nematostella vectensis]XP_032218958.2 archaemetzincin-2 isoform X2 [Nematostella vectensis]
MEGPARLSKAALEAKKKRKSDKQDITVFGLLRNFVEVYFTGKRVTVLDEVNLDDMSCRTRIHKTTGKRQVLVGDILKYLKSCQPSDGYCTIGITWQDLYPSEDWNFVLGEASCEDGCAALSFGHYEPLSFMSTEISDNEEKNTSLSIHNQTVVEQGTQNDADESHKLNSFSGARPSNNQCLSGGLAEKLVDIEVDNGSIEDVNANVIWRLFRGVSHELGHVFGLTHCTFFSCAMNESSSITEAESQPLVVCPVCLRKLQLALGFEVQSRYDKLKAFLETVCAGLTELHIPSECQETVICKKESKFVETIKWLGNIDKCLAQEECTIEY